MAQPRLFVGEWCAFRERNQGEVAAKIGLTESQMSRIVNNELKTQPRFKTLARLATELGCPGGVPDLYTNPLAQNLARLEHSPPDDCIDLASLPDDPNLRINGKPLSAEQRSALRFIIKGLE